MPWERFRAIALGSWGLNAWYIPVFQAKENFHYSPSTTAI
jgi:hypothetical protein